MNLSQVIALHHLNAEKFVDAEPHLLADLAWDSCQEFLNLKAPAVLRMGEADQVSLALNAYALASCGRSEETGSAAGEMAIMCAVRNACIGMETPASKLLRSMVHGHRMASDGHFGSQECYGKWASTRLPPTEFTLTNAILLLADPDSVDDVTRGSVFWIGAKAQDERHEANPQKYTKSSSDIVAEHALAGYHVVHVPGVDSTWFFSRSQYPTS